MNTIKILTAILLPITLLLGCSSSDEDAGPSISFTIISTGGNLGGQAGDEKLVNTYLDQESFDNALNTYSISANDTVIDFTSEQVLLVSMGTQFSGGYSIAAESVNDAGDYIELNIILSSPGADCSVTAALTHPFLVLKINSQKEVRVNERNVTESCS